MPTPHEKYRPRPSSSFAVWRAKLKARPPEAGVQRSEATSSRLSPIRTYRIPVKTTLTVLPGPEPWVVVSSARGTRWVPGSTCVLDVALQLHGW